MKNILKVISIVFMFSLLVGGTMQMKVIAANSGNGTSNTASSGDDGYDPSAVLQVTQYGEYANEEVDPVAKAQSLFGAAMTLVTLIVVAILIYAGFLYATASGDDSKIEKAGKTATYAVVGLIVAFVAGLITKYVLQHVLGVGE